MPPLGINRMIKELVSSLMKRHRKLNLPTVDKLGYCEGVEEVVVNGTRYHWESYGRAARPRD